jgi:hypothetical protein
MSEPMDGPDYSYTEIIQVTVSDEDTASLGVHKDHLTRSSEYFKKACTVPWMKDRWVKSPVREEDTRQYIHWLYSKEIKLADGRVKEGKF